MHKVMRACGFLPVREGSPGVFHHSTLGAEMIVYVDDFIKISPKQHEDHIWKQLDEHILFKDPAATVTRFLGVNHIFKTLGDGTCQMLTEGREYLEAAVQDYMKEIGVTSLKWAPSPFTDDKFESEFAKEGKQAKTALSHLMEIIYLSRLCRGDVLTTTIFLARRVHYWSLNDDRRLLRLMSFISDHAEKCLLHQLNPADKQGAFLDFSPDAELGADSYTTKRRREVSGWRSPPLAGRESCLFASALKRQATPVGEQLIQRHGALLEPTMLLESEMLFLFFTNSRSLYGDLLN